MAGINTLPPEILDSIITADPNRILTVYLNMINKQRDKDKNRDSNKRKRNDITENPQIEYLCEVETTKRLFNYSPWFKLFLDSYSNYQSSRDRDILFGNTNFQISPKNKSKNKNKISKPLEVNPLDIISFIRDKYKYLARFLNDYIKIAQFQDDLDSSGPDIDHMASDHMVGDHMASDDMDSNESDSDGIDIIIEIERNLNLDKLEYAISNIGEEKLGKLHPFAILWIILISSILPRNHCSKIGIGAGITDKYFNLEYYSYIGNDILPMVIINFGMGYQFIIAWDNMVECIIGYIWGGSSGQEYEYNQTRMDNYCKNDKNKRSRDIGNKRDIKLLDFLKSIYSPGNHSDISDEHFQRAVTLAII